MTYNDVVSLTAMALGAAGVYGGVLAGSEVLTALSALCLGWGFGSYASRQNGKGSGK